MFNPIRALARPMLASMFIAGGLDAVMDPEAKAAKAKDVVDPLAEQVPALQQLSTRDVVRANGAVQVLGGAALAAGKAPRLAAAALAATLVPTTIAGHRFWEMEDEAERANHRIHFLKNVSMLGGLLIAAMDTAGEPSTAWRAKHATEHASQKVEHVKKEAELAAAAAAASAKAKKAEAKAKVAEAKGAVKGAKQAAALDAQIAKELAAAKTEAKTEKAKRKAADLRAGSRYAQRTVSRELDHARKQLDTRARLAKRQVIPDARDAARLVRAVRSDD